MAKIHTDTPPKAIIAEDEAELRTYLRSLLAEMWPELEICAEVGDGVEAVAAIRGHRPQIAFLDIRMPGLSGLQVAEALDGAHACHLVFVTAYDEYAVTAFEKQAVDYLLKPVTRERMGQTVERLQKRLTQTPQPHHLAQLSRTLIDELRAAPTPKFLQWLRVQHGDGVELVSVEAVIFLQAQDKYTAVQTRDKSYLLRTSIRDLAAQLDPDAFWQIHRGTIVKVAQIAKVSRSLTGRGVIRLKERPETLTVSRSYLHLFRQM